MTGNSFGEALRITTFGESHGPAIGVVIDGCPPGLRLEIPKIESELARRKTGRSRYTSQRREPDAVEVLSGMFEGETTGAALALLVHNRDARPKDYSALADRFRPGHADFTYLAKYGRRDWRGGGRASARETVSRVAAGAVAKCWLEQTFATRICGWLSAIGPIQIEPVDIENADQNPFFCPDPSRIKELEEFMHDLWKSGDSIGARIEVVARGVPPGLGDPVFDKLDASIAQAMMSIPAVKGVGIGDGFDVIAQRGTQHRDEMRPDGFATNHAGGILGGISTGQEVCVSLAFKPTSSLRLPAHTIDRNKNAVEVVTTGRHDPCVGLRAPPIAEAMLALVLMDHALRDRAQNARVDRTWAHF